MSTRIQTLEWLNARIDALEGEVREAVFFGETKHLELAAERANARIDALEGEVREAVLFGETKHLELAAERAMRVKLAEALQVAMAAVIAFGDAVSASITQRAALDGGSALELMSRVISACKKRGLHNVLVAELSDASRPLPRPDAPS